MTNIIDFKRKKLEKMLEESLASVPQEHKEHFKNIATKILNNGYEASYEFYRAGNQNTKKLS